MILELLLPISILMAPNLEGPVGLDYYKNGICPCHAQPADPRSHALCPCDHLDWGTYPAREIVTPVKCSNAPPQYRGAKSWTENGKTYRCEKDGIEGYLFYQDAVIGR